MGQIIAIGLIAAMLCILLRQYKPEFAMLLGLAAGFIMLMLIIGELRSVLDEAQSIVSGGLVREEYMQILLQALGLCFITQIACDACKDAGENAISAKIEMAGKIAVLAVSLPLFRQVMVFVGMIMRN
jgi:stage III sporulation protein AD